MIKLQLGIFSNLESSLSFIWGATFIIIALTILLKPNLRERVLKIFDNSSSRYIVGGFCLLIAFVHLYGYNFIAKGTDFVLIAIGYVSAFKGIILLLFPSVLKISEEIILSRYMSGWLLFMVTLGIYLLNQALQFITL